MLRALAAALIATGCAASANAATRAFPVGGFSRLVHDAPVEVRVRTGGAPSVRAEGAQHILDRLQVEVRGTELVIGMRGRWRGTSTGRYGPTIVYVTAPPLSAARLAGPGRLSIDRAAGPSFAGALQGPGAFDIGQVAVRALTLDLSGPGEINVAGRAGRTRITASGPGEVQGERLMSDDVSVVFTGVGSVRTNARRTADVRHSGIGSVRIGGHPRCSVHRTGIGDVHCG